MSPVRGSSDFRTPVPQKIQAVGEDSEGEEADGEATQDLHEIQEQGLDESDLPSSAVKEHITEGSSESSTRQ